MWKLTLFDYYMGRDAKYVVPSEVKANAEHTVEQVNKLLSYLEAHGIEIQINPRTKNPITSGWRPPEINAATPNAAPKSKHVTGCACDIYDPDGEIDDFLMLYPNILRDLGLHMEHPSATKGWCHVQTVPPRSGKLVFYP